MKSATVLNGSDRGTFGLIVDCHASTTTRVLFIFILSNVITKSKQFSMTFLGNPHISLYTIYSSILCGDGPASSLLRVVHDIKFSVDGSNLNC